jgi:hypothetical protein
MWSLRRRIIASRRRRHETWDDRDGLDPARRLARGRASSTEDIRRRGRSDPDAGLAPGEQQFVNDLVAVGLTR